MPSALRVEPSFWLIPGDEGLKDPASLPGLIEASSDEPWLTLYWMFRHYSSSRDRDS